MTLSIRSAPQPSDPVFERVLAAIPAGDQWKKGNVIPNVAYGGIPLLVDATPGSLVEIYLDGKILTRFDALAPTTPVTLNLNKGYNTVLVKQGLDSYQTLIVTTDYAIFLRAFADEVYAAVERDILVFEQHLASYFSTRITEHQLEFSDMLPQQFAYRTLLSKLAVRAIVSESSTTRGVDDVVAAVTVNTPVVVEEIATTDVNPPNPVYTRADDFGGHKFHYWLPNSCSASWFGFVRWIDMTADPEHLQLVNVLDQEVTVLENGILRKHYFDDSLESCSTLEDPCEDDFYAAVKITSMVPVWLCIYAHSFDVAVDLPLGRSRLDNDNPFDFDIPLDDVDETAPEDGWVGTQLVSFDEPTCLDSYNGGASGTSSEALGCCPAPVVRVLTELVVDAFVSMVPTVTAKMIVLPA